MVQEASDNRLPVAVIGVGGFGRWTLQALQRSPRVKLVGHSDRDPAVVERVAREANLPGYTDNRSLLAEARPRAVYVAVPPMAAPDVLSLCAARGVHVWKELPLARNLDEGVAVVRQMEAAGLKLAVGTQRRFAVGYRRAWELRGSLGPVFLGRAHYLFNWGPNLTWRGDKASAGGGALLELAYHPIDLLIWLLGLPEEVYGLHAGGRRSDESKADGDPVPIYDTDDTAAAILRYRDGCMASVVATRRSGPVSEELSLHGRGGSLTATSETCLLRDPDGRALDQASEEGGPLEVFVRQAEAFAAAVQDGRERYECSARENLLTQAVIEAVYLSHRTCQPEGPARLLRTHGLTPADCLAFRPEEEAAPAPPEPGQGAPDK